MHHLFLLKAVDGRILATGAEAAFIEGDRVHSRLTFHFHDGSIDDEETTFTQDQVFHLLSDHHVQKGPSFPVPMDTLIDAPSGKVTWHEEKNGKDQMRSQHVDLPEDLGNGLMVLLVENFPPGAAEMKVSWIAVDSRPLLVTLSIRPDGAQSLDPPGTLQRANKYTIHPELHGMAAFVAPMISKQPADLQIWVTDEAIPSFLRLEGPFYMAAPVWIVENAGPA